MRDQDILTRPIAEEVCPATILDVGRAAIGAEADALRALGRQLDDAFVEAALLLWRTSGRVIVCGLGKSGLVARKVAASLMATGTPACFLHAGDAVHGDLGLLVPGDTLMILSNSGGTREFGAILRHAARLAIPVVAITANERSVVAKGANVCLLLPDQAEICPFGSSPTTSTTMMMALGDALAVTIMKLRGASAADLLRLHPGGRLGLDLVVVDSFMHRNEALPLVAAEAPMEEVLALICDKGFGVAGVIDARSRLLGVITDGDVRRYAFRLSGARACEVMTHRPRTLLSGALARDALTIMTAARITSLFVLDGQQDGQIAGLVHIHDLLRLGVG